MKPETIKTLLDGGMTTDELIKELNTDARLRSRLTEIASVRERLVREHKRLLDKIDADEKSIKEECQHYDVVWVTDPSGNNDGCWKCELCGKERRRKEQLGGYHSVAEVSSCET